MRSFLTSHGVSPDRVEVASFGDGSPIASNATAEGRRHNRRAELQLRASGVGAYR